MTMTQHSDDRKGDQGNIALVPDILLETEQNLGRSWMFSPCIGFHAFEILDNLTPLHVLFCRYHDQHNQVPNCTVFCSRKKHLMPARRCQLEQVNEQTVEISVIWNVLPLTPL